MSKNPPTSYTISSGFAFSVKKQEDLAAAHQLMLRKNPHHGQWEVYAKIHGSTLFRWIIISEATKDWYIKQFNPPIVEFDDSIN